MKRLLFTLLMRHATALANPETYFRHYRHASRITHGGGVFESYGRFDTIFIFDEVF